jgi:hypothetical protein
VIDFLNSREDAAVVWAAAILAFVVYQSRGEILGSFWAVIQTLFPKLAILFTAAAAYCAAVVYVAWTAGLWHATAFKETLYAVVGVCFVLVGRAVQERPGGRRYLRRVLGKALCAAVVIEFVVNLYVFPLAVELILFPVLLTLLVTQGADKYDPSKRSAARFADSAVAYIGVAALAYVAFSATTDLDGLLTRENAGRLLVAPALAVALVPFLYAVSWWSRREQENLRKRCRARQARIAEGEETGPEEPLADEGNSRLAS